MPSVPLTRQRILVSGIVQGVGFRPFVYRLAQSLSLTGHVYNALTGVVIEAQGDEKTLTAFMARIKSEKPKQARVDTLTSQTIPVIKNDTLFLIKETARSGRLDTMIGADLTLCEDCLRELFTPTDRRYRYPFINCTHCGARYTLTHRLPYDRATTSMESFIQCAECSAEYTAPDHRRFHAEPNACPNCGPDLTFCDAQKNKIAGDPIALTVAALKEGKIIAVKGLGGFHLMCDARNPLAVKTLRQRKARDAKPFAVMALNIASIKAWRAVDSYHEKWLSHHARPIVLLPKIAASPTWVEHQLPGIADEMNTLGVMLPYTPLHYLLFHEALDCPEGFDWLTEENSYLYVMTSANPNGEPLVKDNDEAFLRLKKIADFFLIHNRAIVARCDDSVIRVPAYHPQNHQNAPMILRRARGFAPDAIKLDIPENTPSILAVGGHYKNTLCITRGNEAFLSPHIGSLDNAATCRVFDETLERLIDFLQVTPRVIAHDAHPDFYTTNVAARLAKKYTAQTLSVFHHHAHIAATLAEHHIKSPVLGLAFDGIGLGEDQTLWGGEWLLMSDTGFERVGHFTPLMLLGGDRAARDTWRPLMAAMADKERTAVMISVLQRFAKETRDSLIFSIELQKRANHHQTTLATASSSLGRYFDAAACALNVCGANRFEGEAAMRLEALAHTYLLRHKRLPIDASLYRVEKKSLNIKPLIQALCSIYHPEDGAALFHGTLIHAVVDYTKTLARDYGATRIALGGGCFVNELLASNIEESFTASGFSVYRPERAPANDGGLSLGQAFLAASSLISSSSFTSPSL